MRWAEDAQNYTVGIYCTLAMEKFCTPAAQYIDGSSFTFAIEEKGQSEYGIL